MEDELVPCLEDWKRKGLSLYDFQKDGIRQMLKWKANKHGGINADEMGLGKTCQVVTMLNLSKLEGGKGGPFLVLAPLSVCQQWVDEILRFGCGILSPVKYTGTADERQQILCNTPRLEGNTVFITAFHLFRTEAPLITELQNKSYPFKAVFVDEAQNLKNYNSQVSMVLKEIRHSTIFYLLTGTPIQNNLKELYSLLCFCDPMRFSDADEDFKAFERNYANAVTDLKDLLDVYMIRRTKDLVYDSLTKLDQVVVYHYMTDLQKKLYVDIISKNHTSFREATGSAKNQPLLNVLMQLRKCVNHPYMFEGVEPEPFTEGEHLVDASAKLLVLDKLLMFLKSRKHRVLIFSQFIMVLTILQDYLEMRGFKFEVIDGTVKSDDRTASIRRFQDTLSQTNNDDAFVFLLSTRAGGVGLNLTAADTVIFMDTDWNPQADIQAMARSHRIGQKKPVRVIRLIGKFTVEQVVYSRSANKLELSSKVMGDEAATTSHIDISDMIKSGLGRLAIHDPLDWSDHKIQSIIGDTDSDGCWLPRNHEELVTKVEDKMNDYMTFEGKSYRVEPSDEEAFNGIVSTAAANKEQPGFSDEQQQEKRKRVAAIRKEAAERRKLNSWALKGYSSRNLPLDGETEQIVDETANDDACIKYIRGDLTRPLIDDRFAFHILFHSLNNGGIYGTSGIFASFRSMFPAIPGIYENIAEMKDLKIGDSHYVEMADTASSLSTTGGIVLAVTQRYTRMDVLECAALEQCFKRVSLFLSQKNGPTAVHITRVGYGTNMSWYTVERLLQKYFTFKGIYVHVYYYSKRQHVGKRKARSPLYEGSIENIGMPISKKANDSEKVTSQDVEEENISSSYAPLIDLSDMVFSLYGIDGDRLQRHKKFITENDGEYVLEERELVAATHSLLPETIVGDENIEKFRSMFDKDCILVEEKWIFDSDERLQRIENYIV